MKDPFPDDIPTFETDRCWQNCRYSVGISGSGYGVYNVDANALYRLNACMNRKIIKKDRIRKKSPFNQRKVRVKKILGYNGDVPKKLAVIARPRLGKITEKNMNENLAFAQMHLISCDFCSEHEYRLYTTPEILDKIKDTDILSLAFVTREFNKPEKSYVINPGEIDKTGRQQAIEQNRNNIKRFLQKTENRKAGVRKMIEFIKHEAEPVENSTISKMKGKLMRSESRPEKGAYSIYATVFQEKNAQTLPNL